MEQELGYGWARITKSEKHDDGTLSVYGKATDDTLDVDQQICDPSWLSKAMPDWFVAGGNIREQHSSIAAGVATNYEEKADGHYITALVVDPSSVKKVETGVLKGFSIGIRSPRVIRDAKAAGGRIVDGMIVEISLVDRPANPAAKLMLAKALDGGNLVAVEQVEVLKYSEDQERGPDGRFGSGGGSSTSNSDTHNGSSAAISGLREHLMSEPHRPLTPSVKKDIKEHLDAAKNNIERSREYDAKGDKANAERQLENAYSHALEAEQLGGAVSTVYGGSNARGESQYSYNNSDNKTPANIGSQAIRSAIENYSKSGKSAQTEGKTMNIPTPADVFKNAEETTDVVEPVVAEEPAVEDSPAETVDEPAETVTEEVTPETELAEAVKSFVTTLDKFDQATFDRARVALADLIVVEANEMANLGSNEKDSIDSLLDAVKHLFRWYEGEVEAGEVANPVMTDETSDDEMLVMSADVCEKCGDKICKCGYKTATPTVVAIDETQVSDIVEKAVNTAKDAVKTEIEQLKSALEAEKAKSVELTAELDNALNKAVAGGPARTATNPKPTISTDALLNKASEYRLKASATSDRVLAQGYEDLADELERKAKKA
jgi:hypothetical protein